MLYERGELMNEVEQTTLHLILSAAMQEFLEKGFKSASLRNIVKTAGVTTGALYGYYDSKEDLFEALVGVRLLSQGAKRICRNPIRGTARQSYLYFRRMYV